MAIMRPPAEARGVRLEATWPDDVPRIETDAGKLQQILYNFTSNAIKFSPEGAAVGLEASLVQRDGQPAVRLQVRDRGPGIPADMQQTVFEKFRQVDASHTKRHGGTGLGLAICRELAQLLGAGIGLESAPGQGSVFWVEVPVRFRNRALPPLMTDRAG
jgi:signal transduction histidine kinase